MVGQRAQKRVVDHRKDGSVRADPERERENRDEGKARAFPERTQTIGQILSERAHKFLGKATRLPHRPQLKEGLRQASRRRAVRNRDARSQNATSFNPFLSYER